MYSKHKAKSIEVLFNRVDILWPQCTTTGVRFRKITKKVTESCLFLADGINWSKLAIMELKIILTYSRNFEIMTSLTSIVLWKCV